MEYPADISHEDSPSIRGTVLQNSQNSRCFMLSPLKLLPRRTARGIWFCWKKRVTRLSGRAILTHGHSFALLCRNYWETGSTTGGVKPERYGFGYRYNDSARYCLYVSHLLTIVFPFRTSLLLLRHFAIIFFFFFIFTTSFDYARILAIRSLPPIYAHLDTSWNQKR